MKLLRSIIVLCSLLAASTAQVTSGSGLPCPVGEFGCFSGSCINMSKLCDGRDDCQDGYDEFICFVRGDCKPDEFRCPTGSNECIPLSAVCDGVPDCQGPPDENNCPPPPPDSPCKGTEFECRFSNSCVPVARRCNGARDCTFSEDEQDCIPPVVTTPPGPPVLVAVGGNVTLACEVDGSPPPFITWRKDLQPLPADPRYSISSRDGVGTLTIRDATVLDAGEYTCEIVSKLYGNFLGLPSATVTVNDPMPFTCQDHLGTSYREGQYYYNVETVTIGDADQAAADVVFIVDESGSMLMEHEWIRREVLLLESQLQERGVGIGMRENLYALVGFGRNDRTAIGGILLSDLGRPDDFVAASAELETSGLLEDGYSGISFALQNIQPRPDTARQMILITDEDRGLLRNDLTRDIVEQELRNAGFILNVIVNQGFLANPDDNSSLALGLNGNGTAYVVDNSSDAFTAVDGGEPVSFNYFQYGDTLEDYVELAFRLGGAAWDLNQLREQGRFAEAFTNAFTAVKVEEVMGVFRSCFSCHCVANDARNDTEGVCVQSVRELSDCVGFPAILTAAVSPSQTLTPIGASVTFQCLAQSTNPNSTLQYSWAYPTGQAADIVVDGDTLTVSNVGEESSGVYVCTVVDILTGAMAVANGTLDIDTRCILGDGTVLFLNEVRVVLAVPPSNISRAADVILVVDESGSMVTEHQWIAGMTQDLDEALRAVNIGVEPRNLFGVVGFGADCLGENFTVGRVITNSADEVLSFGSMVNEFTSVLGTSGRMEDGYSGIRTALGGYEFRNGAKQFILITDEDRDPVDRNLTRESIQELLEKAGVVLNAAISEEFEGEGLRALGIDGARNAYVYDPSASALFSIVRGAGMPIQDSSHGSTSTDYTQLALELGGAAWDLSRLREGGEVAEAFTNAFVYVKVLEIRAQMEQCLNCTCTMTGPVCDPLPAANFSQCLPVTPPPDESPVSLTIDPQSATVGPNDSVTFVCQSNDTAKFAWNFNGGLLPSNAIVLSMEPASTELRIEAAVEENAGVYTCLAHSPSEAFSAAVSAQVEFVDPELDLELQLSPLEAFAIEGDTVYFFCTTAASDSVSIQWLFNYSSPLPSNVEVESNSTWSQLKITDAKQENIGTYTCVATSSTRNITDEDTACLVDVKALLARFPEIFPDVPVTVDEGESVDGLLVCNISCRLTCSGSNCTCPGIDLYWRRSNGSPLSPRIETLVLYEFNPKSPVQGVSSVLSINNATAVEEGRYLCVAELLDEGQTTSAESYITVRLVETIPPFNVSIKDPEHGQSLKEVVVPLGGGRSILCEANKNSSQIYWSSRGELVPLQRQLLGENGTLSDSPSLQNVVAVEVSNTQELLVFRQAVESNAGVFDCNTESEEGESASTFVEVIVMNVSTTSSSIVASPSSTPLPSPSSCLSSLSVIPTPVQSPEPFDINFSKEKLELSMGESGSIACVANHPVERFSWLFGFANLSSNVEICNSESSSELTVTDMQQSTAGLYYCTATSAWTQNSVTKFVAVIFNEEVDVLVMPAAVVIVNETEMVRLECTLNCGCSRTELTWVRADGNSLPSEADMSFSDSRRSVYLTFDSVPRRAGGVYVCVATHSTLGNATKELELRVNPLDGIIPSTVQSLGIPPTLTAVSTSTPLETPMPSEISLAVSITPNPIELRQGATAVFTCAAGSPAESFSWQFGFNPLPADAVVKSISSTMSQLEISNIKRDHAGQYFCTANFSSEAVTEFAILVFIEELLIETNLTEGVRQFRLGDDLKMECRLACACGGVVLNWRKVGGQLPPNSMISRSDSRRTVYLMITSATAEAAGQYECEATRPGESVTDTLELQFTG